VIPSPAQYLLRFDDLCPTMAACRWEELRRPVETFGIRPILAVVPDNRDPDLNVSSVDPEFWERMRDMERDGAAIGLHGYQHLPSSRAKSLMGLHETSEFAGVDLELQRDWIRKGLEILRGHGLSPKLWVAPRHGFDRNTLRALHDEKIDWISDGMARAPFAREGVNWIPQQLWAPVYKKQGLWTICIHPNTASADDVARLDGFLRLYRHQFTSFDRIVREFHPANLNWEERICERVALWRMGERRTRTRLLGRRG